MNFEVKINEILKENMSERGFKLWKGVSKILPNIWELLTASTKKYHLKEDGRCPNNAEHTFEMLYATTKLFSMFNIEKGTSKADMMLIAIALHDSLKYGNFGSRVHTCVNHDKYIADLVIQNKETFIKILSEDEFTILEQMLRFHSGRWSTDAHDNFKFEDYKPEVLFIHMLDMLSTKDLIKIWKKDLE